MQCGKIWYILHRSLHTVKLCYRSCANDVLIHIVAIIYIIRIHKTAILLYQQLFFVHLKFFTTINKFILHQFIILSIHILHYQFTNDKSEASSTRFLYGRVPSCFQEMKILKHKTILTYRTISASPNVTTLVGFRKIYDSIDMYF